MKLKKGVKRFLIVFSILLILAIAFFAYKLFFQGKDLKAKTVKVESEIKAYGYVLNDNDSKEYKEMFNKLKKILGKKEVNEEDYVKQISKMFVYDFFTLSDKDAKTDIGGKMFVHQEALVNFLDKAEDTVYKYIENNLYGKRKQELPMVKTVEINETEQVEFTYLDQVDTEAYQVHLTWEYEKNLGYQKEATLIFVHEGNKLSLVEME